MPLAKLAIRQPIFISMVLLAVTLLGVLSYFRMGVDLYPDISNPVVFVSISFAGASPQDVETLVTKPLGGVYRKRGRYHLGDLQRGVVSGYYQLCRWLQYPAGGSGDTGTPGYYQAAFARRCGRPYLAPL